MKLDKKKNRMLIYSMVVLTLAGALFFGFNLFRIISTAQFEGSGKRTENKYYSINSNATDLQRTIFKDLTKALNEDYKTSEEKELNVVKLVAESFVADFFTWTNKDGNYEVGGTQYIYGGSQTGFIGYVRENFYRDLDLYIAQYGKEELLEVESITAEAFYNSGYETFFEKLPGYTVYLEWTYKPSTKINVDEFQKTAWLQLVEREDGRIEVVEWVESYD